MNISRALTIGIVKTADSLVRKDKGAAGGSVSTDIVLDNLDPVILAASSNISSDGVDATTAQLSPPAGKTTSDFEAGSMGDDINPLLPVNLGVDKYTAFEYSVKGVNLADGTVIKFRITNGGKVLDTYTVVPQWTIGAGGGPAPYDRRNSSYYFAL